MSTSPAVMSNQNNRNNIHISSSNNISNKSSNNSSNKSSKNNSNSNNNSNNDRLKNRIITPLDAAYSLEKGLVRLGVIPGTRWIHKRWLNELSNEKYGHIPLFVPLNAPPDEINNAFTVVPTHLISRETLEHVGLSRAKGDEIWSRWSEMVTAINNSDNNNNTNSTQQLPPFMDFVMGQVTRGGTLQDATNNNTEAEWRACLNACGVTPETKENIMDPWYHSLRLTQSCLYWVRDTLVRLNYNSLLEVQRASRRRDEALRRAGWYPRLFLNQNPASSLAAPALMPYYTPVLVPAAAPRYFPSPQGFPASHQTLSSPAASSTPAPLTDPTSAQTPQGFPSPQSFPTPCGVPTPRFPTLQTPPNLARYPTPAPSRTPTPPYQISLPPIILPTPRRFPPPPTSRPAPRPLPTLQDLPTSETFPAPAPKRRRTAAATSPAPAPSPAPLATLLTPPSLATGSRRRQARDR